MSINRQQFTNAGRDMLGRANNSEQLTIPKVVIGAGRAGAPEDLRPLTELLDYKMDAVITQKVDLGDGILLIDCGFNSSQAPEAFDLCEVGVLARIDNEPERLYSVANVLATGADHVDPTVESIHAFKLKVVIEEADNVTVIIGDSTDILAENIGADTVGPGWFREKIANTLRFKRVVEGQGIELTETADTVTIAQKILRTDLDLYVPVNHPDRPGDGLGFPTIQIALDYLNDIFIPPERQARVHVGAGRYTINSPITVSHPQGERINIIGVAPQERLITGNGAATGSDGNYTWQLNLADTTGLVVGDAVSVVSGNGYAYGHHEITNIAGPSIFVRMRSRMLIPSGGQLNARLLVWPVQIFAIGANGFDLFTGIKRLEYVSVRGQGPVSTFNGINLQGLGEVHNCGICEFFAGVVLISANANGRFYNCLVSNCSYGYNGQANSYTAIYGGLVTANILRNIWSFTATIYLEINRDQPIWGQASGYVYVGFSMEGVVATLNGNVSINGAELDTNQDAVFASVRGNVVSTIGISGGNLSNPEFKANICSMIYLRGWNRPGGIYNLDMLPNDGSLIRVSPAPAAEEEEPDVLPT